MARFGRRHVQAPLIQGLSKYAPTVAAQAPAAKLLTFAAKHSARYYRLHPHIAKRTIPDYVAQTVPTPRPKYLVSHDETDPNVTARRFGQQVSNIVNGLLRSGELQGLVGDPVLGYVPADSLHWDVVPSTIRDALNELAARIKALE